MVFVTNQVDVIIGTRDNGESFSNVSYKCCEAKLIKGGGGGGGLSRLISTITTLYPH